jgi:hypothetical protein
MAVITLKSLAERALWVRVVVVVLFLMIAAEYSIWALEKTHRSHAPRTPTVSKAK